VGPIGDLAESLLKRDAELKDSSQLIPGHGGFLDRFDSMMFVAPILLLYILLAQSHMWPALRGGL
jgi:phosphatidate cytidylyltransferase